MNIQRILTCTDFSEAADVGLNAAFELAETLGAELTVLYVFQRPLAVDPSIAPTSLAQAEAFLQDAHVASKEHLEKLVTARARPGVTARAQVIDGVPYNAIAEASKGADLLVLSTHGYTGAKRLFLGSVAERVVRGAHCPVLTVPAHTADQTG